MISILIPVYNFDVRNLVTSLHKQAQALSIAYEILVMDDCSSQKFKLLNRTLNSLPNVYYSELPNNIGRSKIRNKLAYEALYDNLLFMDCDAKVPSKTYLKKYLEYIKGLSVVCGGTAYETKTPSKNFILRWKYGIKRETRPAFQRNLKPNTSFTTFNFLIARSIFNKVGFNEEFSRYGHEDTLFGYELKKMNIPIVHIENPLIHLGIDSNKDFVFKTKQSIRNLHLIINNHRLKEDLVKDIRILSYYKTIKSIGLTPVCGLLYKIIHKSIEKQLITGNSNLVYLDLMKLGYLCTLK